MIARTRFALVRAGFAVLLFGAADGCTSDANERRVVHVGSKKFTEAVILGEVATDLAKAAGASTEHLRELGATQLLWNALKSGSVDVYAEYTGTLREEIFAREHPRSDEDLGRLLRKHGVEMSRSLGFSDGYGIGMKASVASRLGIKTISDLRKHPRLRFGMSNEFLHRADGFASLKERYRLPQRDIRGLDHDLAYRSLASGSVEVTDVYTTDAEIPAYKLVVLEDDLKHFPDYAAVWIYRSDLRRKVPAALTAILATEGRISADQMRAMNGDVQLGKRPESRVAAAFVSHHMGVRIVDDGENLFERVKRTTREHLFLVLVSLLAAVVLSVPLGIAAAVSHRFGHLILGIVGIIQTIPSLALLVFMIPLLGIGEAPAIVALFLYSLLPIVRNTYAGLRGIPVPIRESAEALGLPPLHRLWLVELPMASRPILAGIKTSAIINVGTATLGALVGAGGYGQPILSGIRVNDISMILEGAIPAAGLALVVQGVFEVAERALVPKGLRLQRSQ